MKNSREGEIRPRLFHRIVVTTTPVFSSSSSRWSRRAMPDHPPRARLFSQLVVESLFLPFNLSFALVFAEFAASIRVYIQDLETSVLPVMPGSIISRFSALTLVFPSSLLRFRLPSSSTYGVSNSSCGIDGNARSGFLSLPIFASRFINLSSLLPRFSLALSNSRSFSLLSLSNYHPISVSASLFLFVFIEAVTSNFSDRFLVASISSWGFPWSRRKLSILWWLQNSGLVSSTQPRQRNEGGTAVVMSNWWEDPNFRSCFRIAEGMREWTNLLKKVDKKVAKSWMKIAT